MFTKLLENFRNANPSAPLPSRTKRGWGNKIANNFKQTGGKLTRQLKGNIKMGFEETELEDVN